jgi:hypothetical protein
MERKQMQEAEAGCKRGQRRRLWEKEEAGRRIPQ